ncbi:tRNA (guanine-N(7)-)-methyltransferase non-catalytic subunit wdr4 [Senna tora]|uniref:tRNA (Guanine-N(7)-)-methyltransferase non-catalytic subunit wdr4 n=1 Tax=Senna tora TaxID=362788 RepID=A0A834TIY5_9FABA|nr:tRNA (guanine-N(7)-)-methyltransferase non-catalytic subunit wdr4 [Senna tora]
MEEGEANRDAEVAPALIAVHPHQKSVAVAVGPYLRVFDLHADSASSLIDDSGGPFHKDSIRAIRFGARGKLFVSAGDDKSVKIWSAESWRCICTVSSEKRVSAVAISNDGSYVCFADKFGVVWIVDLTGYDGNQQLSDKNATPLLSHYCSIITNLEFSPDGRFIVSSDRDFKIRVSYLIFPLNVNYPFRFVSCLAFVHDQECPQGLLVSGSGDSTVRLWDTSSGALLDTCDVAIKAGLLESYGKAEEYDHAVTDLCTTLDGSLVAVALQRQALTFLMFLQGIVLLRCNLSTRTLSVAKVVPIVGEAFVPTSLGSSSSAGMLWMVTGVSSLPGSSYPALARVRVISGFDVEQVPAVVEDDKIPGGEKLLETLQGSISIDENAFLAAAEAVKAAMCNLLIKKQYPFENRESKKRIRNDRKL